MAKETINPPATYTYGRYKFPWTPAHLSKAQLEELRRKHDELGMEALERLQNLGGSVDGKRLDLFEVLKAHHSNDTVLDQLWTQLHVVPAWVDWGQIERGQRFFARYAIPAMIGLALQGFVVENTASPGNVQVLVRTGGFATRVLLRRLLETFQWIIEITDSVQSMQPGGAGHTSTIRVHLLHCLVRQRMMRLAEQRPSYYNIEQYGVPINVLDSMHAISNLCSNPLWLQLPQMGIAPTDEERADWIALFRYIGYLLATPDEYFRDVHQAKLTMESIVVQEFRVTEHSPAILHNFIEILVGLPPFYFSKGFVEAGCRIMNGESMSNELGVGKPGVASYIAFRGLIWALQGLVVAQRMIPALDEYLIRYWRRLLRSTVIENPAVLAGGTKFEFKHVPKDGYTTVAEDNNQYPRPTGLIKRPMEAFGTAVFVFVVAAVAGFAYGCTVLAMRYTH